MADDTKTKDKTAGKGLYPVLPLRDIVVFPYMIVPLFVGRDKSINALEEVMRTDKHILLAAQKNAGDDDPATDAIYPVGTLASVLQLLKLPDGTVKVLVEGTSRARITRYTDNANYFEAEVVEVPENVGAKEEIEALARSAVTQFESYVKLNKKISPTSRRSRTTRSSPTPSRRTSRSRSPTSRRSSRPRRSPSVWSASTR
jgi:ATP-dependent Lon protease